MGNLCSRDASAVPPAATHRVDPPGEATAPTTTSLAAARPRISDPAAAAPARPPQPASGSGARGGAAADTGQTPEVLVRRLREHWRNSAAGVFFAFNVPFRDAGGDVNPTTQARSILETAKALIDEGGAPGVAITCSSDTKQAADIEEAYRARRWRTGTSGSNQAAVVAAMEELQHRDPDFQALRGRVRVAPIVTIDHLSPACTPEQLDGMVFAGLRRVRDYLEDGWVMLGWQNQMTMGNPDRPFAIGGGNSLHSSRAISDDQSAMIQSALTQYSREFAPQVQPRAKVRAPRQAARAEATAHLPASSVATANVVPTTQAPLVRQFIAHRQQTSKGVFHPIQIPFQDASGRTIEADRQARSFLDIAKALIEEGQAPGVAVTYSANTVQSLDIKQAYREGRWRTDTHGSNQAAVMAAMERLQERDPAYTSLQGKVRIAPISTIDYHHPPLSRQEFSQMLSADLDYIKTAFLARGWMVLGWQNQLTADDPSHPFAVGGGVARGASNSISDRQSDMIQNVLVRYSADFPLLAGPSSPAAGSGGGAQSATATAAAASPAAVPAAVPAAAAPTSGATGRSGRGERSPHVSTSAARRSNTGPSTWQDPHDLERFMEAQAPVFSEAMRELRSGGKKTHWMWFVFPQMRGLGESEMSQLYGIGSLAEAKAYWEHPILGTRLREGIWTMLQAKGSADDLLQSDAQKFRSCLTLFAQVAPADADLQLALRRFYGGEQDAVTLALLEQDQNQAQHEGSRARRA